MKPAGQRAGEGERQSMTEFYITVERGARESTITAAHPSAFRVSRTARWGCPAGTVRLRASVNGLGRSVLPVLRRTGRTIKMSKHTYQ
jgi:hypothetical protein